MNTDDLDDVENVAVQQGVAEQAAAEAPEDDGDDLAAETAVTRADGDADDEVTQAPADVEQQPDGEPGEPAAEGDEVAEAPAKPVRRVIVPHDLTCFMPPGAVPVAPYEWKVEEDENGVATAYFEIEGPGDDVSVVVDDIWDEHHGTRRIISWK